MWEKILTERCVWICCQTIYLLRKTMLGKVNSHVLEFNVQARSDRNFLFTYDFFIHH